MLSAKDRKEIKTHILSLTENKDVDYGVIAPPIDTQVALDELFKFFLGDEAYVTSPVCASQANTELLYYVECNYYNNRERRTFLRQVYKIHHKMPANIRRRFIK